ncbi:MAG: glycosyltransferase [Planctomycetes bacterium]|nr:glycosyltransferase [Planctomycetota bacterium]
MGFLPPLTLVFLLAMTAYAVATLMAIGWRRARSRWLAEPHDLKRWPLVTILKPLRGIDEQLEENLRSFARLDYPALQILCCSRDPKDPGLNVARRVAAEFPNSPIEIVAGADGYSANPKVLLLEWMLPLAKGQFLLISDSNVRIEPQDLKLLVAEAQEPEVGLVFQPVVGQGEETAAAAIENFRLSEMAATATLLAKHMAGVDAVMGKGILIRREALHDIGEFSQLRDVLAEDYLMGVAMNQAGWRCKLSLVPVRAIHVNWSFQASLSRHVRHASMRCRLQPLAYPLEWLSNPLAIALVPSLWLGWQGLWFLAAAMVLKATCESIAMRSFRGRWPQLRFIPCMWLKDFLMAGIWLAGPFKGQVNWRGTRYRLAMGTRLIPLDDVPTEPTTIRFPVPAAPAAEEHRRAA